MAAKHPNPSRRCEALTRKGSQCRCAGTDYVRLDSREALMCREHQRQAREGDVRLVAFQTSEVTT